MPTSLTVTWPSKFSPLSDDHPVSLILHVQLLRRVTNLAEKNNLLAELDFRPLDKAIKLLQHASRYLDQEKVKAEKAFRKAFHNAGKKHGRHGGHGKNNKERYSFVKKHWKPLGNWFVKNLVGAEATSQVGELPRKPCHHPKNDDTGLLWTEPLEDLAVLDDRTPEIRRAAVRVRRVNKLLSGFESGFISSDGIKGREWYKHLGVAPGKWLGYDATSFPGMTEAIDEKDAKRARIEMNRLVKLVAGLAKELKVGVKEASRND